MSWKKITAIVVVVIGVVMLLSSAYVSNKAKERRIKIEASQKKANTLDPNFSMSKYSKPLNGKSAEFKNSQKEVEMHRSTAGKLLIGGIILIIIGAGAFYYYYRRR
jgi:hypothetical protein